MSDPHMPSAQQSWEASVAEVIIVESPDAGGAVVAHHIAALVRSKPEFTLGVATGSTPLPVYAALAEQRAGGLDLSGISAFALDEYVGLPREHLESYHSVIQREVTEPLGLNPSRVHVPDGEEATIATAGERYEADLNAHGGVDLQLLGIGTDGQPVYLRDIWPSQAEVDEVISSSITSWRISAMSSLTSPEAIRSLRCS